MRPLSSFLVLVLLANVATAADWLTAPSYYTHDPMTAERVTQYAQIGPYYYYHRPDFQRSSYRQFRSTIQAGNSADNMHIVEEYGNPVRPYEEWRFPYRPFSVPYDQWGPPFGGLGGAGFGGGFGGFQQGGFPQGGFPPNGPIGPGPVGPVGPLPGPGGGGWNGGGWNGGGWNGGGWNGGGWNGGGWNGGGWNGGGWNGGGGAQNFAQPWLDGYYPTYDRNDRSPYYKPYK